MLFLRGLLWILVTATGFVVTGCTSNVAFDHAVIAYDTTTAISNISATYRFTVNAGIRGAVTDERGSLLVPLFGNDTEENPTVCISPMQAEEFTQRLLTPFQEQRLTLLLRQGYEVD